MPQHPDSHEEDINWYYAIGQEVFGPIPEEELFQKIDDGILPLDIIITEEGSENWRPFTTVAEEIKVEIAEEQRQLKRERRPVSKRAQIVYDKANRETKSLRQTLAGCFMVVAFAVASVSFLARCVGDSTEKEIITGITYQQIVGNSFGNQFRIQRTTDVNGLARYSGQTADEQALLDIQGDKNDLFKASLIFTAPLLNEETMFKNIGLGVQFLASADPTWKGCIDWLQDALKVFSETDQKEVSTTRGKLLFKATDLTPLGFGLSVESSNQ